MKGQISIDLLLTLLTAIILLISINVFVEETKQAHYNISTQNQLELEAIKITDIITQTNLLEKTIFSFQTKLKKISYLDEQNNLLKKYPTLQIIENEVILLIQISEKETIIVNKKVSIPKNTKILSSKETGIIVITNE